MIVKPSIAFNDFAGSAKGVTASSKMNNDFIAYLSIGKCLFFC